MIIVIFALNIYGDTMIEKVIQIAREAGEIAREGFGKNFAYEFGNGI